jgi:hypothetical protein
MIDFNKIIKFLQLLINFFIFFTIMLVSLIFTIYNFHEHNLIYIFSFIISFFKTIKYIINLEVYLQNF